MPCPVYTLFDEADRYLSTEAIDQLNQYVSSLSDRVAAYRNLRDQELSIVQAIANRLEQDLPAAPTAALEHSLKTALLLLRCCGMAMLLDDAAYLQDRWLSWVSQTAEIYETQAIDAILYRWLNPCLAKVLPPDQMNLLSPFLRLAQQELLATAMRA